MAGHESRPTWRLNGREVYLRHYYAKARAVSDPTILYRVLRGILRALLLRKNTLRSIHLLPTFDCQARCKMCSVVKFRKDDQDVLTLQDYKSIAEQGARMGALAVTFCGGEPLLVENIEDIIRVFKARHFFVSMASNGIAVTRDYVRRLRSAGLDSIYFGLESLDERLNDQVRGFRGQYQKVMAAISICREEGLQVGLSTVLFPGDMQRYVELAEYCEMNDLRAYLSSVAAVGAAEDIRPASEKDYERAMELSKRFPRLAVDCVGWAFSYFLRPRCPAGKEKIVVTCYGDVMGCSLNHISFGNVRQEPLERIWRRAGRFSQFKKNSDRCLAAFDSYHIENYVAPIARFDKSPVRYQDHPNMTWENEPELFSAEDGSTRRAATDDAREGRGSTGSPPRATSKGGPGAGRAVGNLWQRFASRVVRLVQKHGPHTVNVMGKTYVVSEDVFNPKFYITSEFMAKHVSVAPEDEVLDIGTGSGIQAITAGQVARKVVAIDINSQAVRCASENVKRNGLEGTVSVLQSDLFSTLPPGALFNVILFTPPYFEGRVRTDFDHALYDPGKSLAGRFLKEARGYLRPNGYIQMVYSTRADPERVLSIAHELGWHVDVIAERKGLIETFLIWKLTLRTAH